MKRLFIALMLIATAAVAQENKPPELRSKVFEIHNRDPRQIADAVRLLGSGIGNTGINVNTELKTLTVRDYPENIATIEEAIKRLDQPAPVTPDIEFKIAVLIGSKSALNAPGIPEELEPVVKQLQSTLRYAHYGLMTATVQRTKPGDGIDGSGVAEPTLLGMTPNQERPIFYTYTMRHITASDARVDIDKFVFNMRVPVVVKAGGEATYQNVGFETPVSLRDKEKVVIGTTTMGDKALIVVVTATK
jgi:hypothetical protein